MRMFFPNSPITLPDEKVDRASIMVDTSATPLPSVSNCWNACPGGTLHNVTTSGLGGTLYQYNDIRVGRSGRNTISMTTSGLGGQRGTLYQYDNMGVGRSGRNTLSVWQHEGQGDYLIHIHFNNLMKMDFTDIEPCVDDSYDYMILVIIIRRTSNKNFIKYNRYIVHIIRLFKYLYLWWKCQWFQTQLSHSLILLTFTTSFLDTPFAISMSQNWLNVTFSCKRTIADILWHSK